MQNELDSLLNSLLVQWHKWGTRCSMGKGYPTRDLTCRAAHASRQYDDENGALERAILTTEARNKLMRELMKDGVLS